MRESPNYKELYFKLFRAVTKSIELLQSAQVECEELYIAASETATEHDSGARNPVLFPFAQE